MAYVEQQIIGSLPMHQNDHNTSLYLAMILSPAMFPMVFPRRGLFNFKFNPTTSGLFRRLKKWGGANMAPPPRKKPLWGPKKFFLHKMQEQPLIDVLKVKMALLTRFLVFGDRFRATRSQNTRFSGKSPIFYEKSRKIAVSTPNFL